MTDSEHSVPSAVATASRTVSIGFRAHPQKVWYAVVEDAGGARTVLNVAYVVVPSALQVPAQLQFIRTTLLDVIGEYDVSRAGIRTAEPTAQTKDSLRLNIEGVIQELLASGAVVAYFAGPIARIAGVLDVTPRSDVKRYIAGELTYPGMEHWADYSTEGREALLVALAALNLPQSPFSTALDAAE